MLKFYKIRNSRYSTLCSSPDSQMRRNGYNALITEFLGYFEFLLIGNELISLQDISSVLVLKAQLLILLAIVHTKEALSASTNGLNFMIQLGHLVFQLNNM